MQHNGRTRKKKDGQLSIFREDNLLLYTGKYRILDLVDRCLSFRRSWNCLNKALKYKHGYSAWRNAEL